MLREAAITRLPTPEPLRLGGSALFLDLDGTLAPFAARPDDVVADPRRTRLLRDLQARLDGRLAVVTGRTLEDVDRILEGAVASVSAVHGLIRRDAEGALLVPEAHPGLQDAVDALRDFAKRDSGLIIEEKGPTVALHYRLAPTRSAEARRLAAEVAAGTGLIVQEGDMVEELRPPGASKGDGVRAFMATAPFAGARPVFAGDDATDEHGFAAAADLGGFGVLVGRPRPSRATFGLKDVPDVLDWLEAAR